MFRGILKIRVGWVLEAIRIYLELFPAEKRADATLESLSPYKLRTLLQKVLTVSDWAEEKGYVLRGPAVALGTRAIRTHPNLNKAK